MVTTPQQPELPAPFARYRHESLYTEAQMRAHEQTAIAHFLDTTGQYVTNDATRQAAINAAVLADRESRKVVAWRYMPSPTWGEYVITQDPKVAEVARSMGVEVEELTVGATSKEATR